MQLSTTTTNTAKWAGYNGLHGAFREEWTRGELRGVEGITAHAARVELDGYRQSPVWVVETDDETGVSRVYMPGGAIGLEYRYFLPVAP